MKELKLIVVFVVSFLTTLTKADDLPSLTGYNYSVSDSEGTQCLYASFNMNFVIIFMSANDSHQKNTEFHLPDNGVNVSASGHCGNTSSALVLTWVDKFEDNFSLMINFTLNQQKREWTISRLTFAFEMNNRTFKDPLITDASVHQVYQTSSNKSDFLNRTFPLSNYFYCKRCKLFYLMECVDATSTSCFDPCFNITSTDDKKKNHTVCSYIEMMDSVIYPSEYSPDDPPRKKICIEDYIALQEIIVPAIVGGILLFLLILIFISYIIAYIRRRRKEAQQYEPIGTGGKFS